MFNRSLFSSKTDEHYTPFELYKKYDDKYHFTTDPCTTPDNPLGCKIFYTKEQDGLSWEKNPWYGNVFINPPYGRKINRWVSTGYEYGVSGLGIVVMLLPARTDTKWFHEYLYKKPGISIEFLKGRIVFRGSDNGAPFPSMVVTLQKPVSDSLQQRMPETLLDS